MDNILEKVNIENTKIWKNIILYAICCVGIFCIGKLKSIDELKYMYDSADYYWSAKSFEVEGAFSFFNYNNTFRGYVFPLILYVYCKLATVIGIKDGTAILLANAIVVSLIIVVMIPKMTEWKYKNYISYILIPIVFFLIYWSDLAVYPLSDLYAYGGFVCVILLCMKKNCNVGKNIFRCILIGLLLYCVYNIRSIYFVTIPFVVIFFLIDNRKEIKRIWLRVVLLIVMCTSFFVAAIPQIAINQKQHGVKSIAVITDDLNGGNIFYSQLYVGLFYDRYDTYVGDFCEYPVPQVNYIDRAGTQIIANEGIDGLESLGQYISLIVKYPLDYVGIMVRHLANVFYLPYGESYITDLYGPKYIFAILNWLVIFSIIIELYRCFLSGNNAKISVRAMYKYLTILPCVAILPGSIEARFFVPLYFLIYFYFSQIDFKEFIIFVRKNWLKITVLLVGYLFVMCGICGATMAGAQSFPLLLK